MVGPACPEAGPAAVPGGEGVGGHRASPCQGGGFIQPISGGLWSQQEPGWPTGSPWGSGWKHKLQILVYRIEKFLSKLCTVIFAQYL